MKTISRLFFIVVASFIFTTLSNAQTITLNPKYDTYVVCSSKNSNVYSSENYLKTINATNNATKKLESFIQFDLSRKRFKGIDKLQKATFRIYETGEGLKEAKQFTLFYISENAWDDDFSGVERGAMKMNASPVSKAIKTWTKGENAPGKWYEVDVTKFVKGSPSRYISFRLANKGGVDDPEALYFISSENKKNAPELVLKY